jgi:hypothetical protein
MYDFRDAVHIGYNRRILRRPGFEEFFHPRQTARNIETDDTAGMEGSQRKLRTRFPDALRSDDTYGSEQIDNFAGG